jgi:hypothetical protein
MKTIYRLTANRFAWGSLLLTAVLTPGGNAAAQPFAVEQRRLSPGHTLIRVYDRGTERTIWTRRTGNPQLVSWSADRSALAVLDDAWNGHDYFTLLVWRNGERVHTIRYLPPFHRFEMIRDLIWSPDKRRLLLLGPYSQGEADQGFNRLWCLRLHGEQTQLLSDGSVTRAQWIGTTRVRYWIGQLVPLPTKPGEGTLVETPHERDCP